MELILWRHAEAEDGAAGQSDAERRLTARGRRQARAMADWLAARLPKDTRILVSPAVRTQQTARALGRSFVSAPRIGPQAEVEDLQATAGWPDAGGTVLLVGHQPTLGQFAALLLSGEAANWPIKKGAIWWFSRRRGAGQTQLRAVMNPVLLDQ